MSKRKRAASVESERQLKFLSCEVPDEAPKTITTECVLRRAVAAGRLTAADGDWLLAALSEPAACCARECVASGADCVVRDGAYCNLRYTIVDDCIRPIEWNEDHNPAVCRRGACAHCGVVRACAAHADALKALACRDCGKWLCANCVVARCTRYGPHGFLEQRGPMEVTCDACRDRDPPAKRQRK